MADYQSVTWSGVTVSAEPIGWRSWLPVFKRLPHFSGGKVQYKVTIRPTNDQPKGLKHHFYWEIATTDGSAQLAAYADKEFSKCDKPREITTERVWLTSHRRYGLAVEVGVSGESIEGHTKEKKFWLVTYDALSSDAITMWVTGLLGSAILSALVSFAVGNAIKEPFPNPVIVTIATSTPIPPTLPLSPTPEPPLPAPAPASP